MSVTVQWDGDAFEKYAREAMGHALITEAARFQGTMKKVLNKKGRGEVYIRTKAGANRANKAGVKIHTVAAGKQAITNRSAARILRSERARSKANGKKPKSLRALGFHRASRPGDAPAPETGNYRRSIQIDGSDAHKKRQVVRVGTNVEYARFLEFGTVDMSARPHWRKTLRSESRKIVENIRKRVAATLRNFKGV